MAGEQVRRLTSHTFELEDEGIVDEDIAQAVSKMMANLHAEESRLRRLLPESPAGYYWDTEIQSATEVISNVMKFRVVAKLKEII